MEKDIVRLGYDSVAETYLANRRLSHAQSSLLDDFTHRIPAAGAVLDAGCGAGVPVSRGLSQTLTVTGVDISPEQVRLARVAVPSATFITGDLVAVAASLPSGSFAGICSFYAIIHIPRREHATILHHFHRLLSAGGHLLVCMGADDCPDDVDEFFGSLMYWSHFDAETNLALVLEAGFDPIRHELVADDLGPEASGRHLFVLARKWEQ